MSILQLTRHAAAQPLPRINYAGTARVWRSIAHTAQLEGDLEAVRMAQFRALENEALARQAAGGVCEEAKARGVGRVAIAA